MEVLAVCIDVIVEIMSIPFDIWGFTLSLWELLIYSLLAGIVIWLIGGYFNG